MILQDELIEELHRSLVNDQQLLTISKTGDILVSYDQFLKLLLFIQENKDLLQAMKSGELTEQFMARFKDLFYKIADMTYEKEATRMSTHPIIPEDYYEKILFESIFAVIDHWLEKDCYESAETVAQIIMRLTNL